MRYGKSIAVALLAMVAASTCMAGDAWRWRENGKWVYGDRYPRGAVNPERVTAPGTRSAKEEKEASFQNDKAAKLFPVVVYGIGCPGCESARKLLEARKVPAVYKDPSKPEVYEDFKKYSPQSLAPVIMIGDKPLVGFDPASLSGALDDAGYDKAPPGAPTPAADLAKK